MFVSLLGNNEVSHDKPPSAYLSLACVWQMALSRSVKIYRLLPLVRVPELFCSDKYRDEIGSLG